MNEGKMTLFLEDTSGREIQVENLTDITVKASIERATRQFSAGLILNSLTDQTTSNGEPLVDVGRKVIVRVDNTPIFTGSIEVLDAQGNDSGLSVGIQGRDKVAGIVDSTLSFTNGDVNKLVFPAFTPPVDFNSESFFGVRRVNPLATSSPFTLEDIAILFTRDIFSGADIIINTFNSLDSEDEEEPFVLIETEKVFGSVRQQVDNITELEIPKRSGFTRIDMLRAEQDLVTLDTRDRVGSNFLPFDNQEGIFQELYGKSALKELESWAKKRNAFVTSNGRGHLVFFSNSLVFKSKGQIIHRKDDPNNNVLSYSVKKDMTNRFRLYTFKTTNPIAEIFTLGGASFEVENINAVFDDEIKEESRQLARDLLNPENKDSTPMDDRTAIQLLEWDKQIRKARSNNYDYVVAGHRHQDGKLWRPGTNYTVVDDFIGFRSRDNSKEMLLKDVIYSFNESQGSTTSLTLVDKDVFVPSTGVLTALFEDQKIKAREEAEKTIEEQKRMEKLKQINDFGIGGLLFG